MMQVQEIAISLVLGLSLPIVADVSVQSQAVANLAFPKGEFFGVAELKYEIEKSMILNSYSLRLCASA
ncbi:hypothetical protein [Aphanizomenon sp. UHCC 0183]|uniref:hypothetical protein n=1 Tax=Aphanizomenon sp. UHCC 0183 TaxID=2590028 RepID=UPI0016B06075|nr:hypothetical protein [Aphanizomenon sp. UHCC 0183]MTJ30946.1 hypothetical protein [Aphanizomenon sp. UHCC 0183]